MANANAFRETMWFKLGEAIVAPERDGDEDEPSATVVMLPPEDRYGGAPSREDTAAFGLHTGTTSYIRIGEAVEIVSLPDVPVEALIGELKSRRRVFAIGAGCVALFAALMTFAL